jgi:hypothetical protein
VTPSAKTTSIVKVFSGTKRTHPYWIIGQGHPYEKASRFNHEMMMPTKFAYNVFQGVPQF